MGSSNDPYILKYNKKKSSIGLSMWMWMDSYLGVEWHFMWMMEFGKSAAKILPFHVFYGYWEGD